MVVVVTVNIAVCILPDMMYLFRTFMDRDATNLKALKMQIYNLFARNPCPIYLFKFRYFPHLLLINDVPGAPYRFIRRNNLPGS